MRGSSSPRGRESPPVPGALRGSPGRMAFAMHGIAPDSLRIRSGCSSPRQPRLKVEITARDYFAVLDFSKHPISVESRWYFGRAYIATFELDEPLATAMQAFYWCCKGRNLSDLAMRLADGEAMRLESWIRSGGIWTGRTVR